MNHDSFAPCTGLAAMPSPRPRPAPYFSGRTEMFDDFLEEFELLACGCKLTDPQRIDALVRYVDPSIREFCRTLDGFHSRDWTLFRQSLIHVFRSIIPRHRIMRRRLCNFLKDSSRARMDCEDDVLQYYITFVCYSIPLVHEGHLTEEDRDAAFSFGFHPDDRKALQPRLLGLHPLQPIDVPFPFEDVFRCARAAFACKQPRSIWSHLWQFEPWRVNTHSATED